MRTIAQNNIKKKIGKNTK